MSSRFEDTSLSNIRGKIAENITERKDNVLKIRMLYVAVTIYELNFTQLSKFKFRNSLSAFLTKLS